MNAFFCDDWLLGIYACNWLAKDLLPHTEDELLACTTSGVDGRRICLHCWATSRSLYIEDEARVILECPLYQAARTRLHSILRQSILFDGENTREQFWTSLLELLSSQDRGDCIAISTFLHCVR